MAIPIIISISLFVILIICFAKIIQKNNKIDEYRIKVNQFISEIEKIKKLAEIEIETTTLVNRKAYLLENKITELNEKYTELQNLAVSTKSAQELLTTIHDDVEKIQNFSSDKSKWLAELYSDLIYAEQLRIAEYLRTKKHPAIESSKIVKNFAKENKELRTQLKFVEYDLRYMQNLFPELEEILIGTDSINTEKDNNEENDDPVKYWLSYEEYMSLNETERNQRALDHYINRNKSKWEIGKDYERYIGYKLEQEGYNVEYFGINEKLEDLGRDIIAEKDNKIFIIQCKYWSKKKIIHEKHIAQLFGTTIKYQIEIDFEKDVVGMFITSTKLSTMAMEFAKHLNVEILEEIKLEQYPMIKCNINTDQYGNKTKIYHLPFDQMYDKTLINKKDEFYALTIKEAESAGFRRAYKWNGNIN